MSIEVTKGSIVLVYGESPEDCKKFCNALILNVNKVVFTHYFKHGVPVEFNSRSYTELCFNDSVQMELAELFDVEDGYIDEYFDYFLNEDHKYVFSEIVAPEHPTYRDVAEDHGLAMRRRDPTRYVKEMVKFIRKDQTLKDYTVVITDWTNEEEYQYLQRSFGNVVTVQVNGKDSCDFITDVLALQKGTHLSEDQAANYY
jgi:hypothetical protein